MFWSIHRCPVVQQLCDPVYLLVAGPVPSIACESPPQKQHLVKHALTVTQPYPILPSLREALPVQYISSSDKTLNATDFPIQNSWTKTLNSLPLIFHFYSRNYHEAQQTLKKTV